MIAVISIVVLVVAFFAFQLLLAALNNHKAHKFFKLNSPTLPVVPRPSLLAGHALSIIAPDKNWKILQELHKKYGPTFGYYMIRQPWVSTTDVELMKLIFLDEGHIHVDRGVLGVPIHQFNDSIMQVNGPSWYKARRSVAPSLTNLKVKSTNVTLDIENTANKMAASLRKKVAARGQQKCIEINFGDLMDRFAVSVTFSIFYKLKDKVDFDAEQDAWSQKVHAITENIANPLTYLSMGVPKLMHFCEWIQQFTQVGKVQAEANELIADALSLKTHQERRKLHEAKNQQISGQIDGKQVERGLADSILDAFFDRKTSVNEIFGSLYMVVFAAILTTAETLTCLMWLLAKHQDIQERLRQTILERGMDDDYVVWCINETLRFHASVPLVTGRVLAHDIQHKGIRLAKGTYVMPTTHAVHHDPDHWSEPERFNPDRWRHKADFHPAQFQALGLGPRNCPGGNLTTHEMKICLRTLLTEYRFEFCAQTIGEWDFNAPCLLFCTHDEPVILRMIPLQ